MSDRFYCPVSPVDDRAVLEGDEARHLARVRRVAPGAIVEIFDGRGSVFRAEVSSLGRDRVELRILGREVSGRLPACRLTLASAVPKGDRFDWLVEKATELGVARLIPLVTDRSVVDPRSAKLDRLRRLVIEAAKQCNRDRLMDLETQMNWSDLLGSVQDEIKLVAHPGGSPLAGVEGIRGSSITLAIGPEGGLTDAEVSRAVEKGWRVVDLGPTLLRVETAGLAGCSTILAMAEVDRTKREVG
ncbi:RsmE family RNA methyltransferase [Tundrisphaera lichenicola]|uniref:RsmE family RNA methyltransferase n=1 Tax=Tundrisphaera lichenicola TaxID=2029860 RepID=UPI003EBD8EB4